MANYSIKADLLKLTGAFVTNIKGKWKSRFRLTPVGGKKLTPSSK